MEAELPDYAIAGSWAVFAEWKREHPDADVRYLTEERSRQLVERGAGKGVLHRLEGWEESPARLYAEE